MKPDFFLEEDIAGLKLRPWSLTTRRAMMKILGDDHGEMTEEKVQRQIVSIAWMQSRPPEEVEQALVDQTAVPQIEAFERNFPLAAFPPVAEWAAKQAKIVEASIVTVVPKPQKVKSQETPPPNS